MVVGGRELIDTLWNVNVVRALLVRNVPRELIDTLWNVNMEVMKEIMLTSGSN